MFVPDDLRLRHRFGGHWKKLELLDQCRLNRVMKARSRANTESRD